MSANNMTNNENSAPLASPTNDLIASKFNQLAKKILDELKQSDYSREFFQTIDIILNEPLAKQQDKIRARKLAVQRQREQHQKNKQQIKRLKETTANLTAAAAVAAATSPDKSRDTTQLKLSRENLTIDKAREPVSSVQKDQKQRSAIPQSTILSGISLKVDGPVYPISKSATVGSTAEVSPAPTAEPSSLIIGSSLVSGLVRQTSLRLNKQTREAQQEFIQQQTRPLAASEKLKQRRPTKASLQDQQRQPPTDDSDDDLDEDDDDDDDEDDDEFEYQNLASRRAYLNQRFINQQQEQPTKTSEPTAMVLGAGSGEQQPVSRQRQQVMSTVQSAVNKQTPVNTTNMTVAKQKQRFSSGAQLVRSSTIGAGQATRPAAGRQFGSKPIDVADQSEQHEPRSLGGLLTSHDISQLYKPHMNYSTSLLGNHRLSDDDEIIIIPTAQSPSLMSASVSPVGHQHPQHHHHHQQPDGDPDRSTNNIDESSERFSISRTKSFWEKLARSQSSGPNLVVDTKSSQCSPINNSTSPQQANGGGNHAYPAAMKSAFDRMDSTGGSGNSHYSGCSSSSSTSGDEQNMSNTGGGHLKLAERRAMLASAAAAKSNRQRSPANASINPTINQLVQQDQINRSDRFRQTR